MASSVIIADQLRAAREALGLSLGEVAQHIEVDPQQLKNWEEGVTEPSVDQLWTLADLYNRGIDFFVKETPRPPVEVWFRLEQKREWQDLPLSARQVIAQFEELCRAAKDLDQLLGLRSTVSLPTISHEADPENVARAERERLRYNSKPMRNARRAIEEQGIRVFQLAVPNDEFSGFSWWHEEYGPCILINARDYPGRRNFTLAHEYVHLLANESPSVCDLSDIVEERFANKFAAAFLMPEEDVREQAELRELLWKTPTLRDIKSFAGRYGVSPEALAYRLHDLQFISRGNLQSVLEELQGLTEFRRRPKAPSWRRRLGDMYVNKALTAFYGDRISLSKLARYFGLDVRKVLDVLARERPVQPDE
ncbi:MAG: helix-turn-helix domain-containing protein [Candidatus Binatia bacterium]